MVSSINSGIANALFGGSTSTVDADLLTAWAKSKAGIGVDTTAIGQDPNAPLAPVWTPGVSPSATALVQRALTNKAFFDTGAKLYSDLGATGDYSRLFALYSGVTTLQALAGYAEDDKLSASEKAKTEAQFARGLKELEEFFAHQKFDDIRLVQGDRVDSTQTTQAFTAQSEDYLTGIVHRGGLYDKVQGLASDAKFNIVATSLGGTVRNVAIDLSEMGSIPRSLSNVISYINGKLSAAGASSRLEAVDQTPKTSTVTLGGRVIEQRYTGSKQYALKVDVRASEKVSFQPVDANPAFYVVGGTSGGARLIKLEDSSGAAGQPVWLDRPAATQDPIGAYVSTGWYGAGAPYSTPPANVTEQRTNALMSTASNNFETVIREAGEAVLKLDLGGGRTISVSTAWRADDLENWRVRDGESEDRAIIDDMAERLTQLLHEQGVAAGVDVWEDNGEIGLSVVTGDQARAASLTIGGKLTTLTTVDQPTMVGGLRDGVFARRYEAAAVADASDLFVGKQTFVFTTASTTQSIVIDGGDDGIDAATLQEKLNTQLRAKNLPAAATLVDNGGSLTLQIDSLHDIIGVSTTLNGDTFEGTLQAPGAWASGGLPVADPGEIFGDSIRTTNVTGGSPLLTYTGALDIQVVVATPTGEKTVSMTVSALERANDPDIAPGQWSAAFQARLDSALNEAGVYVGAGSGDLSQWSVAESSGQRLVSVSVNGDQLALESDAPAFGLGGAHAAVRSFTSAEAATGVSDDAASLLSDQTVSVTFDTIWGARTVTATLDPGDPRTLESAALRLNEALSAQGYDAGVVATDLTGGGAGLRVVTGSSHTVRGITNVTLGGVSNALTLDPIDSVSHGDDPVGALTVAERAARGAAITETMPGSSYVAPSANASAWFPGRAFDVTVGGKLSVGTARSVAAAADGSVYVLADLSGDSASSAIKGASDVALLKYDSAGKLIFSEMLGATVNASGFALAVSDDGKVAIAGSVSGGLTGTTAKGGEDSFVSVFDSSGKELWTARRGATGDDQALALQFAPNGNLVVAGKTASSLSGQVALGANDAYLRAYSANGAELFTRQFGTGGDDAATALLVRDDGSGGMEIFTGGVENSRGVVRSFTYTAGAGFAAGANRDIGYFFGGAINTLAADASGALYVGGEVGADRLTVGSTARGAVAGKDGFVVRMDDDLVTTTLDRATYLGSAQDDAVKSIAIVDGTIYAAGVSGGVLAGSGGANTKNGFIARLDDSGDIDWSRTFTSAGGTVTVNAMTAVANASSPLDVLGLPSGVVNGSTAAPIAQRSALRVGDEFKVGVDGRRLTTIKIGATDTLTTLVTSINRAIAGAGKAEIVSENGVERIKISARQGQAVRIDAGRDGYNALPALGFAQGVVSTNSAAGTGLATFGLGLIANDLKLNSKAAITSAKAELTAAISIIRAAYDKLLNPHAKAPTAEEQALAARRQAAGAAPEYYTAQLANYQAALSRLTGG